MTKPESTSPSHQPPRLRLATIVSAPFGENTYIAHFDGREDCLVFDPGLEPGAIVKHLERQGLRPAAFMITHGHSDHIGGNTAMKRRWPDVPLVIGRGDAPKLTDAELNLSATYGISLLSPPADVLLDEGDTYRAAGFELEVFEIPGHSSGHVVYLWRGGRPNVVFGGDVLFRGSIGRTDFPDGSFEALASGIHRKLFTLADDTLVLPGHGDPTTVGEEKRHNPFVGLDAMGE
ncbi:MAG TPA: MBL fold metallo-hydrolase [Pirellulales bacterium]|nr:MBL fold metallo-hydrolase [Pirellulales bacterium]